jgi:hypothetical protein
MEGIEEGDEEEDEEDDEEEEPQEEPQQTSMVGGNINDYNLNTVFDNEFNVDNINNYQLRELFEDTLDERFENYLLSQGYTDDTSPGLSLLVYRIMTLYILDYLGWGDMSEQERDEFDLVSIFESYRPVSTNSIINDLRTFILRLPQEPTETNSGLLANAETFLRDPNTGEITTFNDSVIFQYMVGTLILALRRVMPGSQYFMPSVDAVRDSQPNYPVGVGTQFNLLTLMAFDVGQEIPDDVDSLNAGFQALQNYPPMNLGDNPQENVEEPAQPAQEPQEPQGIMPPGIGDIFALPPPMPGAQPLQQLNPQAQPFFPQNQDQNPQNM